MEKVDFTLKFRLQELREANHFLKILDKLIDVHYYITSKFDEIPECVLRSIIAGEKQIWLEGQMISFAVLPYELYEVKRSFDLLFDQMYWESKDLSCIKDYYYYLIHMRELVLVIIDEFEKKGKEGK